jgi:hypothetical protein
MQQFGLPLQQKSIHLRMSEVEALIRVIVAAKGYATGTSYIMNCWVTFPATNRMAS